MSASAPKSETEALADLLTGECDGKTAPLVDLARTHDQGVALATTMCVNHGSSARISDFWKASAFALEREALRFGSSVLGSNISRVHTLVGGWSPMVESRLAAWEPRVCVARSNEEFVSSRCPQSDPLVGAVGNSTGTSLYLKSCLHVPLTAPVVSHAVRRVAGAHKGTGSFTFVLYGWHDRFAAAPQSDIRSILDSVRLALDSTEQDWIIGVVAGQRRTNSSVPPPLPELGIATGGPHAHVDSTLPPSTASSMYKAFARVGALPCSKPTCMDAANGGQVLWTFILIGAVVALGISAFLSKAMFRSIKGSSGSGEDEGGDGQYSIRQLRRRRQETPSLLDVGRFSSLR